MLKIKGLAEMPEQNIAGSTHISKSLSISSDKAELLTSTESTWGPDSRSSPAPLSPSMRRKRLRKSSTGSGSGSTGTDLFRMIHFMEAIPLCDIIEVYIFASGFGGLGLACWPLVRKFAGSNPAEAVRFLRAKKSSARLPSEGK